jgi:hypothetical protein
MMTRDRLSDLPDADVEVLRIDAVLRRNRRAMFVAATSGFAVANGTFFALRFAVPEQSLGLDALAGLGAAALVGLVAWVLLRARGAAFAGGPPVEEAPDPESLVFRVSAPIEPASEVPAADLRALRAELRAGSADVRAAQRRARIATALTMTSGLVVPGGLLFAIDLAYTKLGSDASIGGSELFVAAIAGLATAFAVARVFAPRPTEDRTEARADDRDWFRDTLATTGSIALRAPSDLGAVLARLAGVAVRRWTLLDGGGALFADAAERHLGVLGRLVPMRARSIAVTDADGVRVELARPGRLFARWSVRMGASRLGSIRGGWLSIVVEDADGAEIYRVRRSWIFGRRYSVVQRGKRASSMRRARRRWFSPAYEAPSFTVELPRDAPFESRILLVAAALVIDLRRM